MRVALMRVVTVFPRRVRVEPQEWIEMPDGCRLAATIWLPEDAVDDPVPAILEYIPYRKNDATALRDAPMHGYFAGHGYAAVRVDMRGSGDSDGLLTDEYLPLEQQDGLAVLRWLASQPWCTGKVGIIGKSWGGFNGLQIAAHRPPELAAVVSICSTDDRYADDVHYMGGCVLAWDMLSWASTMLAYGARPPDPDVVGERWREVWLERLEKTPPFIHAWLAHQRRDDYWKQGSVCEDYRAITSPVFMVGGWADGYRNAILRFLQNHSGVCMGLIGPWGHVYPQDGAPGPAIGFLQEALRWWDYWLKGVDTGIMAEPKLRMWIQDAVEPRVHYPTRPGRWVGEASWPPELSDTRRLVLGDRTLQATTAQPVEERGLDWFGAQIAGADAGVWCAWGGPTDFPGDQRVDDGLSLSFTSEPLAERMEIVGFPTLRAVMATDRSRAVLAVRLCDVWPDGQSTLITRGVLNLTHRNSHEHPAPLEPGCRYLVAVKLNSIAYTVPAGHRLRLALSQTYWPWLWPSPEPVRLSVFTGSETVLELPVNGSTANYEPPVHFGAPESAPRPPTQTLAPALSRGRSVHRDIGTGVIEIVNHLDYFHPLRFLNSGLDYVDDGRDVYTIAEGDPLSAKIRAERSIAISRGGWQTRVETASTMTSTAGAYIVTDTLEAYEGEIRIFAKTWDVRIPRDLT